MAHSKNLFDIIALGNVNSLHKLHFNHPIYKTVDSWSGGIHSLNKLGRVSLRDATKQMSRL